MLPTNVVSFVKKMVATNDSTSSAVVSGGDPGEGSTLGKLRQTLSSSLLTATETVTKLSPTRQPVSGDSGGTGNTEQEENSSAKQAPTSGDAAPVRPPSKYGCCRVCLKAFTSAIEFFRVCCECSQKVCEDCASYSTEAEAPPVNTDSQEPSSGGVPENTWRCSICRRRRASRRSGIAPLPATLPLGVPITGLTRKASVAAGASPQLASQAAKAAAASGIRLGIPGAGEGLRRRHSDVRLSIPPQAGTPETNGGATPNAPASFLDLPTRSPDMRRHSDVSPASLRDLEKKLAPSMSRQKLRSSMSPGGSVDETRLTNTPVHAVERPEKQQTPAESSASEEERRRRSRRRHSRAVPRQRSCDEESDGSLLVQPEPPVRRASAYDLLQHGTIQPDLTPAVSQRNLARRRGESPPANPNRRPSLRTGGRVAKDGESPSNHVGSSNVDGGSGPQTGLSAEKGMEDERRRRRGSQVSDVRTLPATPAATATSMAAQRSHAAQQGDGVSASVRRQTSVGDAEAIKIVIDDVDARPRSPTPPPIPSNLPPGQRHRVKLRRETTERCPRTRGGFGMRVVGGRGTSDGRLYASVVWTVPGGPADRAGLSRGDKVLEWCGVPLTDRSFEEVSAIVEESGDTIDILIERTEASLGDSLDDQSGAHFTPRRLIDALQMELDDKSPASPTRRKLPKTPEQIMRERTVSGRLQMQVWYQDERRELVVAVLAADDLATRPCRDTPTGSTGQSQPNAYARLRLLPESGNGDEVRTDVAEATTNPIWNATFDFGGVNPEDLMESSLEVALWDQFPPSEPDLFLGECSVELRRAVVEERPVWYRLEDPRGIRGCRSAHVSPRGSLASAPAELARRLLLRRGEFSSQRSFSDEAGGDASPPAGSAPNLDSPPTSLLHPDAAWAALTIGTTKRRGSSQSEQLEVTVEGAVTPIDLSRSLPGSRRSSFQSSEQGKEESIPLGRRRSSSARGRRGSMGPPSSPPEEIASHLLGRRESCRIGMGKEPVDFSLGGPRGTSTPSDEDEEDDSWSTRSSRDETGKKELSRIILGPGQVQPRGFGMGHGFCAAEVKLGLLMSKGQLEVEVVCARNIAAASKDYPPDTYVKTYLRDGPRWLQKRKTRVVRRSMEPQYRQTLRYSARDVLGRSLLIMLWERTQRKGFVIGMEANQGLGGGEVALDRLQLTRLTLAWYPLFPLRSLSGATANASDAYEGPRGPDGGPSSEEDDDGGEEQNMS